jgi:hypothetical protein
VQTWFPADLLRYGSGEHAFLVTKKLTFQQIQRNGSAIESYERTLALRAEVVNCARDQLLAGACLSLDKNSGIRSRDPFDLFKHRLQSRALAYDLHEVAPIMYLVTGTGPSEGFHRKSPVCRVHSSLPGLALHRRLNTFDESLIVERFCPELHCACSHRLHPHFRVAVSRYKDGRNPAMVCIQLRLRFETDCLPSQS